MGKVLVQRFFNSCTKGQVFTVADGHKRHSSFCHDRYLIAERFIIGIMQRLLSLEREGEEKRPEYGAFVLLRNPAD